RAFEPRVVFTERGPIASYAHDLDVRHEVVPTGGAFYYSAHAKLAPRMLAHFFRTFPSGGNTPPPGLRHTKPTALHPNPSVLLAWAAAARREHVPVVWQVREVLGPHPGLRRWHANYIVRHAKRIVAISHAVSACFPPSARVNVVHNAVDLAEFRLDLLE